MHTRVARMRIDWRMISSRLCVITGRLRNWALRTSIYWKWLGRLSHSRWHWRTTLVIHNLRRRCPQKNYLKHCWAKPFGKTKIALLFGPSCPSIQIIPKIGGLAYWAGFPILTLYEKYPLNIVPVISGLASCCFLLWTIHLPQRSEQNSKLPQVFQQYESKHIRIQMM